MSIISFAPDVRSLLAKRGAYSGTDCTMKKIQLTKGFCAIVDDEDFERVSSYKWFATTAGQNRGVYARRMRRVSEGVSTKWIHMHRFILGEKKGCVVDHINRDGLDNRKCNLRFCTPSQNNMNTRLPTTNTSGYRGIFWEKNCKKWEANLRVDNKSIYGGVFKTAEEAARAYDEIAKKYHGGFAQLNFPLQETNNI